MSNVQWYWTPMLIVMVPVNKTYSVGIILGYANVN